MNHFCPNVIVLLEGMRDESGCTHRENPLGVSLSPHVGVMDLLQNHPSFIMFPVLVKHTQCKSSLISSSEQLISNSMSNTALHAKDEILHRD